jgi:hypothetical protein
LPGRAYVQLKSTGHPPVPRTSPPSIQAEHAKPDDSDARLLPFVSRVIVRPPLSKPSRQQPASPPPLVLPLLVQCSTGSKMMMGRSIGRSAGRRSGDNNPSGSGDLSRFSVATTASSASQRSADGGGRGISFLDAFRSCFVPTEARSPDNSLSDNDFHPSQQRTYPQHHGFKPPPPPFPFLQRFFYFFFESPWRYFCRAS